VVTIQPSLPKIAPPPPAPPAPAPPVATVPPPPAPAPPAPAPAQPAPQVVVPPPPPVPLAPPAVQASPVAVPPIPPAATPVPPGGATASAQATARREEKARKHASQSAYTTRPAGVSAVDWFYPAVGLTGVLVVLMAAGGLAVPRQRRAFVEVRNAGDPDRGRGRRYRYQ
jgi:hypothetical protein